MKIKVIQQWQYVGKVHPKLLSDEVFETCRKYGIDVLQSYVTWSEIEKERDRVDFSAYDELVERLEKHELRWAMFAILGPYYATPKWFRESKESVFARCLEHGLKSGTQSIWNPYLPKYVDRFLHILSEHYGGSEVLDSVLLGISGCWGEALYPAYGGFHSKDLHVHPGWWCGDRYALQDFRRSMQKKYDSIGKLNRSWNADFRDFSEVSPPRPTDVVVRDFLRKVFETLNRLANSKHGIIGHFASRTSNFLSKLVTYIHGSVTSRGKDGRWMDLVEWYLDSMVRWADFWLTTARRYFPKTEIYLVTGGDGTPMLGADFSAQTKVAAKHGAGIRITNQTNSYGESFALSRLVSSASRFYNTYFTTEEAGITKPYGVIARLFDAITSGAEGVYFKSLIGIGIDPCTREGLPVGKPTRGAVYLALNAQLLTISEPIIEVAVLFPNTSVALNHTTLTSFYKQCSLLRDVLDFDIIDERMISEGVLERYRFLILLKEYPLPRKVLRKIKEAIEKGLILIAPKRMKHSFSHLIRIRERGKGHAVFLDGRDHAYLEAIKHAIYNYGRRYPWRGLPIIDDRWDGVYASRFENKILYYNSNGFTVTKRVTLDNAPRTIEFEVNLKPHSLALIEIDKI